MDMYLWLRRNLSRNRKSSLPIATTTNSNSGKKEEDERLYGITEQLIEFIKSFTLETFKNFPLQDADEEGGGIRDANNDLSEWQERHAVLVLSKSKELSQLRFRLCPRLLKEHQFWSIYFTLVWNYVAEYELNAVRLAKLKQMREENGAHTKSSAIEVEMSEAKPTEHQDRAALLEHTEV